MNIKNQTEHLVSTYGDLIFDLCLTFFQNTAYAQLVFQSILKALLSTYKNQKYSQYERSWVLKTTCHQLFSLWHQNAPLSSENQIQLDTCSNVSNRLKQFHSYFQMLYPEDQLLLLLKDKYHFPYSEIASAFSIPEDSLKIQHQQALKSIEEWIWKRE